MCVFMNVVSFLCGYCIGKFLFLCLNCLFRYGVVFLVL